MSTPYMLHRDDEESKRLTEQHDVWIKSFGYRIHPDIKPTLPDKARIADIATGTGTWLIDLAQTEGKPTWQLDGFDISSDAFTPAAARPPNVALHVADIKRPFDASWHGQFDLVHVRLLFVAMQLDDWAPAIANVCSLLKPGGWIQWDELDPNPAYAALRGVAGARTGAIQRAVGGYLFERVKGRGLLASPGVFKEAFEKEPRLQDVGCDVVSSDRLVELRAVNTRMVIGVVHAMGKAEIQTRAAAEGGMDFEALSKLINDAYDEVPTGGYVITYFVSMRGKLRS